MIILILAGGEGTRLWPLSQNAHPKQFLRFGSHTSLLQKTILRCLKMPKVTSIVVSTQEHYQTLVKQQLRELDVQDRCDIIVEPSRKNTGPALAFAMRYLEEIKKAKQNDLVLVLPSDHQIVPEFPFVECVTEALELANQHYLVIFGICPNRPETGYGYIQASHAFSPYSMNVRTFVEKPDRKTAEQYLAQGGYYWNSGMVLTSIQTFWEEMRNHAPDIYSLAQCSWEEVVENYALFPNRSLDYALLEHSKRLLVCPLELSWFDLGSWDHVYEALEKDEQGNVLQGSVHTIDTHNCLILGKRSLIATIGLEDLCIVETDGAILISKKGTSQQVKSLVNILATTPQGVHHEHNLS